MRLFNRIKLLKLRRVWRRKNKHNITNIGTCIPIDKITVGKGTYGTINVILMHPDTHISIGNYCSIGPNVTFMGGGEHNYRRISTFPFQTMVYKESTSYAINRDIVLEDDVWLGYGVLIMPGVRIGQGSVIGANSIVTRDVAPYSVFVGNKVIKKRFSDDVIEKLIKIDYSKIDHRKGDAYQQFCQQEVCVENVDEILKAFTE